MNKEDMTTKSQFLACNITFTSAYTIKEVSNRESTADCETTVCIPWNITYRHCKLYTVNMNHTWNTL